MLEGQERYPRSKEAFSTFRDAFRHYIVPSFAPARPPLKHSDIVFTQGSCFAENIARTLREIGVFTVYMELNELVNSPLANRTFLEYALMDKPITNPNHLGFVKPERFPNIKAGVAKASAFIFTIGLAYCRYGIDGDFRLQATKGEKEYTRLTTVDENQEHIEAVIAMVKAMNPSSTIILTLSPIPLTRSIGHGSAFVSDCMSKSVLRVALGQVMTRNIPDVYYWPAFEGIRWLSGHLGPIYGVEGEDQRHPGQSYINEILSAFVDSFFQPKA
jgi:hypothetical protein